ncbi:MAG: energy transducer TonB, partial [Paludibacter sp.]|nr:energy transducer TonB [Paludibacter sp.]
PLKYPLQTQRNFKVRKQGIYNEKTITLKTKKGIRDICIRDINIKRIKEIKDITDAAILLHKDLATREYYLSDMRYKMVEDGFLIVGERGVYHGWCGAIYLNVDRYRTTNTYFVGFNKKIQQIKTETVLTYHYVPYKNERVYIDTVIYKFPTELDSASKYVNPEFIGGKQAFVNFAKDNLRYPVSALKNLIRGTVIVSFLLDIDGSIKDVYVIRKFDVACDIETLRFLTLIERKWNVGKLNGKNVPVEVFMTVCFRLEEINERRN